MTSLAQTRLTSVFLWDPELVSSQNVVCAMWRGACTYIGTSPSLCWSMWDLTPSLFPYPRSPRSLLAHSSISHRPLSLSLSHHSSPIYPYTHTEAPPPQLPHHHHHHPCENIISLSLSLSLSLPLSLSSPL